MIPTRSAWRWIAICLGGIVAVAVGWSHLASGSLGDDLAFLETEAESNFEALRSELVSEARGEWTTTFAVGDSSSCVIFADPERVSYGCDWSYETLEAASTAYE